MFIAEEVIIRLLFSPESDPEQSCPVVNKLTGHEPAIQSKNQHLVSGQLHKNT